jgi:acyl carrier protein
MTQEEAFSQVVTILSPYAKDKDALRGVAAGTNILKELKVNSARLVDIILGIEDTFGIEVEDEEADEVVTVGDAVKLILAKVP